MCFPCVDSPIFPSGLFSVCRFAYYPQWTVFRVSIHLLSSVDCVFPCVDSPIILSGLFSVCRFTYYPQLTVCFRESIRLLSSVDFVFSESRFAYYPQWTVCFPCVTISTNDLCRSLLHPKYSDESPAEKGSTLKGNH